MYRDTQEVWEEKFPLEELQSTAFVSHPTIKISFKKVVYLPLYAKYKLGM